MERLRALGLSDEEILDVVLAVAARCFFSTVLEALGVQADPAYRALDPELRAALTVGRPIEEVEPALAWLHLEGPGDPRCGLRGALRGGRHAGDPADLAVWKQRRERFVMLTAYDALTARVLDEAGIRCCWWATRSATTCSGTTPPSR